MNRDDMDRNKAKGMLWGLIVGDAFGSPIQFSGKDSHPWITEMVKCPVFNLPAGYWTDDGSMAMCIMDSYVRKGGYVPPNKDVVKALLGVEHDMTWNGLFECIPPAYAEHIGRQLIAHLEQERAA